MAATLSLATAFRSGILDSGINTACGASPLLKIYAGAEPADANAALGGATLLATLTLSASPFGAAASGVVTAASITSDSSADDTGTATFGRLTTSGGTVLMQGNCGTSAATFALNTVAVVTAAVVSCSSFTITLPGA